MQYNTIYNQAINHIIDLIQSAQEVNNWDRRTTIDVMFTKYQYLSVTVPKEYLHLREHIAKQSGIEARYKDTLTGNLGHLPALVKAFNEQGIYCIIKS